MNQFRKNLSILLILGLLLSLFGCAAKDAPSATEETAPAESYTVTVRSAGGMALPGIDVYVYADDTLQDLKQYGETDEKGQILFSLPQGEDYAITLSGAPRGYAVEPAYAFSGNAAAITLTSSLISGESLSGATLGVGDVMYDFSVTTPAGETVTLSEMLAEKDTVLLNFWYTTCTYCVAEFPYMEEAWQSYSDDVGIIALNPLEEDEAIASFQSMYDLSLTMAKCPAAWSAAFGISGYPTSIIVDRYGVICLMEAGGITSLRPFVSIFDHFTGDGYEQVLYGSLSELVTTVRPTVTMDTSEAVSAVFDGGTLDVTYRPETEGESAEYAWPFVITEKNGESCLKASNQEIESSYAILYADIYLEAGQAIGFDYLASSEKSCDILYVIVDDQPALQISGYAQEESWETCYPWVALESGWHEVALCYLKDSDTNEGDDTVYLKNLHIMDQSEISVPTYIPRTAAQEVGDLEYEYVDIFLNEADGYYHVGSEKGPLLLADLMGYTMFNEEKTVWELAYYGDITIDGHSYYEELVDYCSYASNSSLNGVCTVNEELAELLQIVDDVAGFDSGDDLEWLKICKYYEVYGTDVQLTDPIKGLATFCAYDARLGSNTISYDRPIMPRGLLSKFVPQKSGVYRVTSHSDSQQGVDGWIFHGNRDNMYTFEHDERMYEDSANVSMVYYMEAGQTYYIDIAYWDLYEVGTIPYDIEYIGPEYDLFRLAAPGYFTYDTNATGELMYALIAAGIDVVLGEDGYYHEDLGLDAKGNQRYGSILYADFTGLTPIFSKPIATVHAYNDDGSYLLDANGEPVMIQGMIDLGGFDFSKTEDDLYILSVLEKFDYDEAAADAYLRDQWGEDYDAYAESYQLADVCAGRYHGKGQDLTEEIRGYLDKIITSGSEEKHGCVPVDERLAEILQLVMDKYTFQNVDHSWTKLCYYYDHLGPKE
ncbi:MAG: TlpA family protein disulfide reductase [Oscillospiraceae bacterium]|nr:TlpA family protein disulfide reductase [Oscillospiraceae bacterium]